MRRAVTILGCVLLVLAVLRWAGLDWRICVGPRGSCVLMHEVLQAPAARGGLKA